jgi:hypothetical protein
VNSRAYCSANWYTAEDLTSIPDGSLYWPQRPMPTSKAGPLGSHAKDHGEQSPLTHAAGGHASTSPIYKCGARQDALASVTAAPPLAR